MRLLPRSLRNSTPSLLLAPVVSAANITNGYDRVNKAIIVFAAASTAAPRVRDDSGRSVTTLSC